MRINIWIVFAVLLALLPVTQRNATPSAPVTRAPRLPIRPLVLDRTFVKITMVSESWSRTHTLRAVIMTYGNSIILFTPSTPSYTAT